MSDLIKNFEYKGIKQIEIPIRDIDLLNAEDYGKSIIEKYLPNIMATHNKNACKIDFFYEYFKGTQDIYKKTRLYDKDADNNHMTVENHAYRQVNFKVGFLIGERRVYTTKDGASSNDLTYLEKYLTDCDYWSKDKDLKEWVYATGIGVSSCEPRTDIIIDTGRVDEIGQPIYEYASASQGFNIEKEAPFRYDVLNPAENFVVYSSSRSKEPLFCVSIVEIDVGDKDNIDMRKLLQIETRYATFTTQSDFKYSMFDKLSSPIPKTLRYLPIVEHSINAYRMGIIELNRDLFNSINTLVSSVEDIIVDNANVILVFKNTDINAEQVKNMKKAGAIILKDNMSKGVSADLDTIKVQIDFDGFDTFYEQRLSKAYDIAGVPLASGQVTSGGDTGQARLLGGGWNNAYTIIRNDITSLLKGDYAVLRLMLQFAREIPSSPINDIYASDIEIVYRINQNDNFLVKAEGIAQLYGVNMPKEAIIKASGLFSDTNAVASQWEKSDRLAKQQAQTTATETIDVNKTTTTDNTENQNDNNSQE